VSELEDALRKELQEAEAEYSGVKEEYEAAAEKADKLIEEARQKRNELLEDVRETERTARERVTRATKALKVIRGEPLTAGNPGPVRKKGEPLPESKIEKVLATAKALAKDGKDITVASIDRETPGVSTGTIGEALDELRKREEVRKAGTGRSGPNTVTLYKLYQEGE